jgi:hypothetical protein
MAENFTDKLSQNKELVEAWFKYSQPIYICKNELNHLTTNN